MTAPFMADGALTHSQMTNIEKTLAGLELSTSYKIMMIHHPPVKNIASARRALKSIEEVQGVIEKYKINMVLHGHLHKTMMHTLNLNGHEATVLGTSAAGSNGKDMQPSQYYLLHLNKSDTGWSSQITSRQFDTDTRSYIDVDLPEIV